MFTNPRSIVRIFFSKHFQVHRILYLLLSFLVFLPAQLTAIEIPQLARSLDTLASNTHLARVRVGFGTFTFGYTDLPTPFSRWLQDRLALAITSSERLILQNRTAMAAMDPALTSIYADFFRDNPVDAMLHGKFFLENRNVRVELELTSLSTTELLGIHHFSLPITQVPSFASVEPVQASANRARELASILPTAQSTFQVTVATDRGVGAHYTEGEYLSVHVTVNEPGYVRLFHIDSAGVIQQIWPNRFGGGNGRLEPGQIVTVPSPQDPFAFLLTPPFGTEFIKAVASTEPFTDQSQDFSGLGTGTGVMTRGLAIQPTGQSSAQRPAQVSEALTSYYIGPR